MARTDQSHVRVWQSGQDMPTLLPATAYEPLTHALTTGAEWWEGTTLYGATVLIRCATIADVTLATVESMAEANADTEGWAET